MELKRLLFRKKEPSEVIIDHFKLLCSDEVEQTVLIGGDSKKYVSRFFTLSKKGKSYDGLFIDTLIPAVGNKAIQKSKSIKVKYTFRGAKYSFSSKYIGTKKVGDFDSLKIEIPEKIIRTGGKKHQRGSYRAITSVADPCFVVINKSEEKMLDISTGGFSFLTPLSFNYYRNENVPLPVTVSIPSTKTSFDADVRICHFVPNAFSSRGVKKHKVAVQFSSKLKFNEEEAIAQYVIERQREELKKGIEG